MTDSLVDEFDALYRAHWGRLAGTLRLLCGDAMTADDLAQEAFTLTWVRWTRVRLLDRPEGWVYVTGFRLARKRLLREARRPRPDAVPESIEGALDDRVGLQQALAELPMRKRQAVVARHVLGYDGPTAATLLGMQPDGFRQLLNRAVSDLRVSPALLEEA